MLQNNYNNSLCVKYFYLRITWPRFRKLGQSYKPCQEVSMIANLIFISRACSSARNYEQPIINPEFEQ